MDGPARARRVEVAAERLPGWLSRFRDRHGELRAAVSDDGDAVRVDAADGAWARITVPWPPLGGHGGDPLPALLHHIARPRRVALVLVRRGGFAVGVVDGDRLVTSKVGGRHVQGRTKAGGWSQQRYARRRAQQARRAFQAAADVVATTLLPVLDTIDGVVGGGDRTAVDEVLADPRLEPLMTLPRGRFLAVSDPRQAVLERAAQDCRNVVVEVWDPSRR